MISKTTRAPQAAAMIRVKLKWVGKRARVEPKINPARVKDIAV